MIDPDVIQQIIEKVDIVDWVESYVPLKQAGGDWKGLCPFHDEKTPSFHITPAKASFYCFGCQKGGNVITFVKEYDNLSFIEAVRKLADHAGIVLVEQELDPKMESRKKARSQLIRLQEAAADFFHFNLLKNKSSNAQAARDYLSGRGFGTDLAKEWQLGYAPDGNRDFFDWASQNRFSTDFLVDGGLAAWRDENQKLRGAYPRFRHRLMFPVRNENGEVIAFSGRILSPDQQGGKYVNSPETAIFHKSRVLFGYHKSRRAISKSRHAIICEGQIDLISAMGAGVENIVAPLGTALTEEHAKVLHRQADEVTLCFDSDTAGINAAVKAFRVLASKGLMVRLALLPEGEDPDSFIRKYGVDTFRQIIAEAMEYFDFHIDRSGSRLKSGPLRDRLSFARELAADLALIENKMVQDSLINRVSFKLGVSEDEIRKQVFAATRAQRRYQMNHLRAAERRQQHESFPPEALEKVELGNRCVRLLCRLLLSDPVTKRNLGSQPLPDYFNELPGTALLAKVWQGRFDPEQPATVHGFLATLAPSEQTALTIIQNTPIHGATGEWVPGALRELEKEFLNYRIQSLMASLGTEGVSLDQINQINSEILYLRDRKKELDEHFGL